MHETPIHAKIGAFLGGVRVKILLSCGRHERSHVDGMMPPSRRKTGNGGSMDYADAGSREAACGSSVMGGSARCCGSPRSSAARMSRPMRPTCAVHLEDQFIRTLVRFTEAHPPAGVMLEDKSSSFVPGRIRMKESRNARAVSSRLSAAASRCRPWACAARDVLPWGQTHRI